MTAHAHTPRGDEFTGRDTARLLRIVTIACAALIVIGAILLWPSGDRTTDPLGLQADPQDAHVTTVEELPCTSDPNVQRAVITFEVRSGAHAGEVGSIEQGVDTPISAGDDIRITVSDLEDGTTLYSFYDFERSTPLIVLVVLFVGAVVALGRWRGLGALGRARGQPGHHRLVRTALARRRQQTRSASPLVTAGAVAIALLVLYLAHGARAGDRRGTALDVRQSRPDGCAGVDLRRGGQLHGTERRRQLRAPQSLGTGIDPRGSSWPAS